MAGDDDRPGGPARGYIPDGGEGGGYFRDEPQAAHWDTISSSLSESEVRERIRQALAVASSREPVIGGKESARGGFLIRFRSAKHVRAAEINLAPWDGGTQVHLALPAEHKARDLAVLARWLRLVLGIAGEA